MSDTSSSSHQDIPNFLAIITALRSITRALNIEILRQKLIFPNVKFYSTSPTPRIAMCKFEYNLTFKFISFNIFFFFSKIQLVTWIKHFNVHIIIIQQICEKSKTCIFCFSKMDEANLFTCPTWVCVDELCLRPRTRWHQNSWQIDTQGVEIILQL